MTVNITLEMWLTMAFSQNTKAFGMHHVLICIGLCVLTILCPVVMSSVLLTIVMTTTMGLPEISLKRLSITHGPIVFRAGDYND